MLYYIKLAEMPSILIKNETDMMRDRCLELLGLEDYVSNQSDTALSPSELVKDILHLCQQLGVACQLMKTPGWRFEQGALHVSAALRLQVADKRSLMAQLQERRKDGNG